MPLAFYAPARDHSWQSFSHGPYGPVSPLCFQTWRTKSRSRPGHRWIRSKGKCAMLAACFFIPWKGTLVIATNSCQERHEFVNVHLVRKSIYSDIYLIQYETYVYIYIYVFIYIRSCPKLYLLLFFLIKLTRDVL